MRFVYSRSGSSVRFMWPKAESGTVSLSRAQLSMLLEGIGWRRPHPTMHGPFAHNKQAPRRIPNRRGAIRRIPDRAAKPLGRRLLRARLAWQQSCSCDTRERNRGSLDSFPNFHLHTFRSGSQPSKLGQLGMRTLPEETGAIWLPLLAANTPLFDSRCNVRLLLPLESVTIWGINTQIRIPHEARDGDHYRGRPRRAYCGHRVATPRGPAGSPPPSGGASCARPARRYRC